jgi:hypothetical protein
MIHYIFDPEVIHECALKGLGLPKPEMFDVIAREIERRYPGHIEHDLPWIYSIAGGAMIQMKLYFASLWEYVMIWGTPIGSEGHSGRHRVSFWDTVIDGETWYFAEGQFEKRIYRPGDRIFVGKGQACGMNFTDGVWAVEYERGPLMLSLPFGLADELLSTLDYTAAIQTVSLYSYLIGRHWGASYNHDYPLLWPFKKVAAVPMKFFGWRMTRALIPPAPIELNAPRAAQPAQPVARRAGTSGRGNGSDNEGGRSSAKGPLSRAGNSRPRGSQRKA